MKINLTSLKSLNLRFTSLQSHYRHSGGAGGGWGGLGGHEGFHFLLSATRPAVDLVINISGPHLWR